ncbi:hypothetical protein HanRHA438_Chr03g0113061 [Helianthus annuus]|nr:hypothetical protein HanRHA438_Chr03g0113061 [Helianthus annuus]
MKHVKTHKIKKVVLQILTRQALVFGNIVLVGIHSSSSFLSTPAHCTEFSLMLLSISNVRNKTNKLKFSIWCTEFSLYTRC